MVGGFALYMILAFTIILGSFYSVLLTGTGIPVEELLYMAVALSLLYTVAVQNEVRLRVSQSKWYLGY